ncbi:MAG: hypothetical protein WAV73_02855 [Candidatus Moraniibacteriota bacterium]
MLVSFAVAIFCFFASSFFPTQNTAQVITKNIFFLVLLPSLYIKLILSKNLSDFGWNLKNKEAALRWGIGVTVFTLLLFYLMLNFTQFKSGYVLEDYLKNSFWLFLIYELIIINFRVFIFSYFFQGFLLSIFQKQFGQLAIAIQAGLFFALFFFTKNITWQTAPIILLSITGGFLAYKTKSFFYSYFMSIFVIIILDTYIIYLTR